jgi:hypothetical protein
MSNTHYLSVCYSYHSQTPSVCRDSSNSPLSVSVFSGTDVERLIKLLKKAARDGHAVTTPPMKAHVAEDSDVDETRFIHTIVPIADPLSTDINRLFIYSEKVS